MTQFLTEENTDGLALFRNLTGKLLMDNILIYYLKGKTLTDRQLSVKSINIFPSQYGIHLLKNFASNLLLLTVYCKFMCITQNRRLMLREMHVVLFCSIVNTGGFVFPL